MDNDLASPLNGNIFRQSDDPGTVSPDSDSSAELSKHLDKMGNAAKHRKRLGDLTEDSNKVMKESLALKKQRIAEEKIYAKKKIEIAERKMKMEEDMFKLKSQAGMMAIMQQQRVQVTVLFKDIEEIKEMIAQAKEENDDAQFIDILERQKNILYAQLQSVQQVGMDSCPSSDNQEQVVPAQAS